MRAAVKSEFNMLELFKNAEWRYFALEVFHPSLWSNLILSLLDPIPVGCSQCYPIETMQISVPDRLDNFIKTQVKLGLYTSSDAFVTHVLEQFQIQQFVQQSIEESSPESSQSSTESFFGCMKGRISILGDIIEPIEEAGWELLP